MQQETGDSGSVEVEHKRDNRRPRLLKAKPSSCNEKGNAAVGGRVSGGALMSDDDDGCRNAAQGLWRKRSAGAGWGKASQMLSLKGCERIHRSAYTSAVSMQ